MAQSFLAIGLTEEETNRLSQQAAARGVTLEALAADYLREMIATSDDPLLSLAGTIRSSVPDVAERHHEYLGQGLAADLQG